LEKLQTVLKVNKDMSEQKLHYPFQKQSFMQRSIQTNKFGCKMSLCCLKQNKMYHGMYVGSPDLYKQNETVKKTN
jgi:hypothetical protein